MRFSQMLKYAANVFKKDRDTTQLPKSAVISTKIDKHYSSPRPVRDRRVWKYRQLTSGVPIQMQKYRNAIGSRQMLDTRRRDDGYANCPECGHNRYKTALKGANGRRIACRYCGKERVV